MSFWRQFTRGIRTLTHRDAANREIADEVASYVEESTAAFIAQGLTPEDARRAALVELGSPVSVRQQVRESGWENALTGGGQTPKGRRSAARKVVAWLIHHSKDREDAIGGLARELGERFESCSIPDPKSLKPFS